MMHRELKQEYRVKVNLDTSNLKSIRKAINHAAKKIDDFRIPLGSIHQHFMQSRKLIFKLKGPGKYKDLSPRYKKRKQKEHGFIYPILKATGRLESSITSENQDHIGIVRPRSLTIGSAVPYAVVHQEGRGRMPKRPFLFWGLGGTSTAHPLLARKSAEHIVTVILSFALRKLGEVPGVAIKQGAREAKELVTI